MVTADARATRRWRLVGYRAPLKGREGVEDEKGRQVISDETCVGDAALDASLRVLEARSDFLTAAAEPETLGNRQRRVELVVAPRTAAEEELLADPVYACVQCELPEPECRRRAAINDHAFEQGPPIWGAQ